MEIIKHAEKDFNDWYRCALPSLTNYGMWLRGNEINTLPLEEYQSRPLKTLFVRLSTYENISGSFTHFLLYQTASSMPEVFPDIAYLPPLNDVKIFEKHNVPWLLGTQTKLGPKGFSLIGFSNSIIQEIMNIPKFLSTSGIPLKRSERLKMEDIPIIVLGGANAPFTASVWGEDSLIDGVFIGSNPEYIRRLFKICADGVRDKKDKSVILENLEAIPCYYNTDKPNRNLKKEAYEAGRIEMLEKGIVPYDADSIGSGYLEISEGCRAACSFCEESWSRRPYREIEAAELLSKALNMKREMGLERINIFSFNFNMHSQFYRILWELAPYFNSIGFKSQRIDMLSGDIAILECQHAAGKMTYSAGMEGISARLRRYLNKNIDEDVLKKSIELILRIKARQLKIFLLSTGIEDESDFMEFDKLLSILEKNKDKYHANTRVIFSVTPLVKFPWTPLEFDDAYAVDTHNNVIARMKEIISPHKFEMRLAIDTNEYLVSQILARSHDERILNALLNALKETGFVYYVNIDNRFLASFLRHLAKENLNVEDILKGFSYEESLKKAWSSLDMGIKKDMLWNIFKKNKVFNEAGETLDRIELEGPIFAPEEYRKRFNEKRKKEIEARFSVNIKNSGRGILRKYIGIALARALMKADSSLAPHFRRYGSSFWEIDKYKPAWITGDDIITLIWAGEGLDELKNKLKDDKFIDSVNRYFGNWGSFKGMAQKSCFTIHVDSPYEFNGSGYFNERSLKYTLYKSGGNSYKLKFSERSLKKDIILDCVYTLNKIDSGEKAYKISMDIKPGRKFNPEEFAQKSFSYPHKNDWINILIHSIG